MLLGLVALLIGQFSGSTIVPIFTKVGLQYSSPLQFVFFRFFFATIVFSLFYIFSKKKKLFFKDYKKFMIVAALLFINVIFFTIGVQYTTVLMSQILYTSTPIFVGIIAHFFLKEKMTHQRIIGLCISLVGVLFLIFESGSKQAALTFGTPLGNAIVLFAVLGYSGWILYSRSLANAKKYTSSQITFFTFFFIACYELLLLPVEQYVLPHSHLAQFSLTGIGFAFIVASGSVILYFFIQLGIKKTSAFTASLFQYIGPFFSGLFSIPLLHEKPSAPLFIGGALIIIGVFYATTFTYIKKYMPSKLQ